MNQPVHRPTVPSRPSLPLRVARWALSRLSEQHALTDALGFHIRYIHYYEPLPSFGEIDREKLLRRRLSDAIDWNVEGMLALNDELAAHSDEIDQLGLPGFTELDAAVYYALLRHVRPARVIEIGAGDSTRVATTALARNGREGRPGTVTCIEPYPSPLLAGLPVELVARGLEDIDLDLFRSLSAGDVLFIDSTHTVKYGSDVCKEVLEILPVLQSGVLVHFHDIFFPYDYPPDWLIKRRLSWTEQYLVEAFMAYNSAFEVLYANHLMSVDHPEAVSRLWPDVMSWPKPNHRCGSFWIRKR